jgi:hypothetical protein
MTNDGRRVLHVSSLPDLHIYIIVILITINLSPNCQCSILKNIRTENDDHITQVIQLSESGSSCNVGA